MKKVISLFLALVLCLSVTACGSKAAPESDTGKTDAGTTDTAKGEEQDKDTSGSGDELAIDVALGYSEPHSMDPTLATGADQFEILFHMSEGLMKFAAIEDTVNGNDNQYSSEVVCGQAESYEFDEASLTYTFHLRDDIFWSDGEKVTADKFVYALQRLVDPKTAASNGTLLNNIVKNATAISEGTMEPSELGIAAVDEKTLTVTLENSCSYFLDMCTHYGLYPLRQDVSEANGDTWTEAETFISNGAYVMTDWVHDSYIELTKNEKYYDYANLGPSKITFHLSDSETSNMAAYQSGEYNFVSGIPTDQIESLIASGDAYSNPRLNVTYLYLNCETIPDWRVRAAITLAIDKENLVTNVTQDGSTAATGLIPNGVTNSENKVWTDAVGEVMYAWLQEKYPDYDLSTYSGRCELAKVLYDEAVADGWDGSATMEYKFNTSDTNKAVAEAVQSDLSGILEAKVTLGNIDSAGYTDTISKGGFHLARLGYGITFNDAIGYYQLFGTNGNFEYSGWSDANYDKLVEQASTMQNGPERDKVLEEIEQIMYSENGFSVCPLYYASYVYCMKDLQNTFYSAISNLTYFGYATK